MHDETAGHVDRGDPKNERMAPDTSRETDSAQKKKRVKNKVN